MTQINLEDYRQYEWIGTPPDPWLDHFKLPIKTELCNSCGTWVVPSDSQILWTTNLFKCLSEQPAICPNCNEETDLYPENYEGDLHFMWYKHNLVPLDKDKGISPHFYNILAEKIRSGKSVQVLFTGRAGEGKSYFMIKLMQILNPHADVSQLVFERGEFIYAVRNFKAGTIVCADESSYMVGKRSWMAPDQRQLVLVWESLRFMLLPIFTTVINLSLLDKTVREHLIVFQVNIRRRGEADCYSLHPHPFEDQTTRHHIQRLYLPMPDFNFCDKSSCLLPRCKHLKVCPLLRGRYETKKMTIQTERYKNAEGTVSTQKTFIQWLEEFVPIMPKCYYEKAGKMKLNRELIELELGCSGSMAQRIRQTCTNKTPEQIQALVQGYKDKTR